MPDVDDRSSNIVVTSLRRLSDGSVLSLPCSFQPAKRGPFADLCYVESRMRRSAISLPTHRIRKTLHKWATSTGPTLNSTMAPGGSSWHATLHETA